MSFLVVAQYKSECCKVFDGQHCVLVVLFVSNVEDSDYSLDFF